MTIVEELRRKYTYDPVNGTVRRRWGSRRLMENDGAISIRDLRIRVYVAAWIIYHGRLPKNQIDHRDRDHGNIKIDNLREATRTQNNGNSVHKSTTGFKGVCITASGRWQAGIHINNRRVHLGVFGTKEEAHAAYAKAAKDYFGEFARLEVRT